MSDSEEKLAPLFTPPYYAVIFASKQTDVAEGYAEVAVRMVELAAQQPGFLGVDSARENIGITVSYWRDIDAIKAWKAQAEHKQAQRKGKLNWYQHFTMRIAKVEREYDFTR